MVEITREGLFTLDSAVVHKAVFHCLPYTQPPSFKFLGVIYMSVCLSVCLSTCLPVCLSVFLPACLSFYLPVCLSVCLSTCLSVCLSVSCGGVNRQSLYCKAICVLIYCFYSFDFYLWPSYFIFCVLPFDF